jgi:hypothetical protein
MIIPAPGRVLYIFNDGREQEAYWQNRSRKFSWTEQAKLEARERALAYRRGFKS